MSKAVGNGRKTPESIWKVTVTETYSRTFCVVAGDRDEALQKADDEWHSPEQKTDMSIDLFTDFDDVSFSAPETPETEPRKLLERTYAFID